MDEADGGPVREGQPVTLRLEARGDRRMRLTLRRALGGRRGLALAAVLLLVLLLLGARFVRTLEGDTVATFVVRNQFVMEAFAVTVTGGLLGIAMGLAIAKGVAACAGWKTIVTLWSIVLSVGVSAAVGLVFGSYPAMRAAASTPSRPCGTSRRLRGRSDERG